MIKNCDFCGKSFSRKPSQIDKYKNNCCSRKCAYEYKKIDWIAKICQYCGREYRRNKKGRVYNIKYCSLKCVGLALRKRIKFKCDICGKEKELPLTHFNRRKYHTCSRECQHKVHSKKMTGKDNSNYKGSRVLREDVIRKRLRRAAIKRDEFICKYCNSKIGLEVHHIIPFEVIGEDGGLENLITLCHDCHNKIHLELSRNKNLYKGIFEKIGITVTRIPS